MNAPPSPAARGMPEPLPRGWVRVLAWPLLALLAVVYGTLGGLRRLAYRRGWRRTERAACPVLSVGNLAAGGSGKTPLVDWLLRAAAQAGCRPVAISRGYRNRSASDVIRCRAAEGLAADPVAMGDEPALLARRNPALPVYVARRRVLAARLAAIRDRPGLIVLDDAFQHLGLARDLDVVLIDGQVGVGNGRLLPLGPLREPLRAARRAHAVLIAKAEPEQAEPLRARVAAALGGAVPVFTCAYRPAALRRLDEGAEQPLESLRGRSVRPLCGIAHPQGFVRTLEALGARVERVQAHADHFAYPDAALQALAAELQADPEAAAGPRWITTEKDAVKLAGRLPGAERLWVLEMAVVPDPAAQAFFFDFIARCAIE